MSVIQVDRLQCKMEEYLEALRQRMDLKNGVKLQAIQIPRVHQFIAEAAGLCNPESIFVSNDSPEDVACIKRMVKETWGEEPLAVSGRAVHFDGPNNQKRDRETIEYLVPKSHYPRRALNRVEMGEGLAEVKGFLRNSMKEHAMSVRFICLGPLNSVLSILCLPCTDSRRVAHSEYIPFRPGHETFTRADPHTPLLRVHSSGRFKENEGDKI